MVRIPDRDVVVGLARTVNETLPLPVDEEPLVTLIHGLLLVTFQAQLERLEFKSTADDPPVPGIVTLVALRE